MLSPYWQPPRPATPTIPSGRSDRAEASPEVSLSVLSGPTVTWDDEEEASEEGEAGEVPEPADPPRRLSAQSLSSRRSSTTSHRLSVRSFGSRRSSSSVTASHHSLQTHHTGISGRTATPNQDDRYTSWRQIRDEVDEARRRETDFDLREAYDNDSPLDPGTTLACWKWICAHDRPSVDAPYPRSYIESLKNWTWYAAGEPPNEAVHTYIDDNQYELMDFVEKTLEAADGDVNLVDARKSYRILQTQFSKKAFHPDDVKKLERLGNVHEGGIVTKDDVKSLTELHFFEREEEQDEEKLWRDGRETPRQAEWGIELLDDHEVG